MGWTSGLEPSLPLGLSPSRPLSLPNCQAPISIVSPTPAMYSTSCVHLLRVRSCVHFEGLTLRCLPWS